MSSIPSPFPTDRKLDDAILALASQNDHVAVIRVVEAWLRHGNPSTHARLAAARAFFELRLMDRATMRVREVLEASPQDLDALTLLVQIYLERGWKERARGPLAELSAAGAPVAAELASRSVAEFIPPEASARQIEREGTTAELLSLAERFAATGSFTRATGILERVRRQDPRHPRALSLLWALAGDLSAGPPLEDILAAAVQPLSLQLAELPDEPEHTESVDASERSRMLADLADEVAERNFPSLFKSGEAAPADDDPGERTATMGMASEDEMQAGGSEDTDARVVSLTGATGDGDTQILLVLRPGEDMQTHRRREESDRLRETFNLREYQASMGVAVSPDVDRSDVLEEEDESVVLLGRSEAPAPAPAAHMGSSPIEVIERHPAPMRPVVAAEPPPPPPEPPARRQIHPLWVGGVLLVLLLLGLAALALILPALLAHTRSNARTELLHALSTDDLATLLRAEGGLTSPSASAELAELELVIWWEFNGDPARLAAAQRTLEAGRFDPHRRAMLAAELELAMGNPRGAAAAAGLEPALDDEERLLLSRIALGGGANGPGAGDADRANDVLADLDQPGAPRYRLARARALAAAGLYEPALALVDDVLAMNPTHARAQLFSFGLSPDGAAGEAARSYVGDASVPPRLAGEAIALRVRSLLEAGLPERAVSLAKEGLQRDGQNVDLHLVVADHLRGEGKLLGALAELDGVATFDERVWTAQVLLLVDLDRLEEADRVATGRSGTSPDRAQTLRAIVGFGEAVPEGEATALRAAAKALSAVRALDPEAMDRVREAALPMVRAAPGSGFEAALQGKVRALVAELAPKGELAKASAALLACCSDDAAVHLSLARAYEQTGERALAAQHFDRAVSLGPELALAWYERGRFYEDAGDTLSRSAQSWHSYLALAPTGPRAERVAGRMAMSRLP